MSDLYRAQILLEQEQHEKLSKLAAAEGRSMSAIVREAVAEYLVEQDETAQKPQWEEALEKLAEIREEMERRFGVYEGDLTAELREERVIELEEVMWGKR